MGKWKMIHREAWYRELVAGEPPAESGAEETLAEMPQDFRGWVGWYKQELEEIISSGRGSYLGLDDNLRPMMVDPALATKIMRALNSNPSQGWSWMKDVFQGLSAYVSKYMAWGDTMEDLGLRRKQLPQQEQKALPAR